MSCQYLCIQIHMNSRNEHQINFLTSTLFSIKLCSISNCHSYACPKTCTQLTYIARVLLYHVCLTVKHFLAVSLLYQITRNSWLGLFIQYIFQIAVHYVSQIQSQRYGIKSRKNRTMYSGTGVLSFSIVVSKPWNCFNITPSFYMEVLTW